MPPQRTIVVQKPSRRYLPPHLRNQCNAKRAQDTLCALMLVQSHNCGPRNLSCTFCGALRWADECNSICCFTGKVKLPDYPDPPSPVRALLLEESQRSNVFRKYIRQLNNALSLASVKIGSNSNVDGYNPTVFLQVGVYFFYTFFKSLQCWIFQGKCYKLFGPLKSSHNDPKYAQIYVHDPLCERESTRLRLRFMKLPESVSAFELHTLEQILSQLQVGIRLSGLIN